VPSVVYTNTLILQNYYIVHVGALLR
jgi:hypothetical protein